MLGSAGEDVTLTAQECIRLLNLTRHPEGGYFRETYRSVETIPHAALPRRFTGDRAFATAIYFLLEAGDFSAFHRLRQDEMWHHYLGSPLLIHVIDEKGAYRVFCLGCDLERGERPQTIVPAGCFFAASVADDTGFALVGCTVAPGFDFADFEMPSRTELIHAFPQHADRIARLSR